LSLIKIQIHQRHVSILSLLLLRKTELVGYSSEIPLYYCNYIKVDESITFTSPARFSTINF
jgi:hypothetical protein